MCVVMTYLVYHPHVRNVVLAFVVLLRCARFKHDPAVHLYPALLPLADLPQQPCRPLRQVAQDMLQAQRLGSPLLSFFTHLNRFLRILIARALFFFIFALQHDLRHQERLQTALL